MVLWWFLIGGFCGICLWRLPFRVELCIGQREDSFKLGVCCCLCRRSIWRRCWTLTELFTMVRKKLLPQTGRHCKIRQVLESEKTVILAIALSGVMIEKWTLCGTMDKGSPTVKSLFYGGAVGGSWWFYGVSRAWLEWQCQPVLSVGFAADTNWQFQCMIKATAGQIMVKSVKIAGLLLGRMKNHGAKERNRKAHANGYC